MFLLRNKSGWIQIYDVHSELTVPIFVFHLNCISNEGVRSSDEVTRHSTLEGFWWNRCEWPSTVFTASRDVLLTAKTLSREGRPEPLARSQSGDLHSHFETSKWAYHCCLAQRASSQTLTIGNYVIWNYKWNVSEFLISIHRYTHCLGAIHVVQSCYGECTTDCHNEHLRALQLSLSLQLGDVPEAENKLYHQSVLWAEKNLRRTLSYLLRNQIPCSRRSVSLFAREMRLF